MKTILKLTILVLSLAALPLATHAQLVIPGADGSDQALNITTNTVIDLSQAVTAPWDANNTANAGKGVYDSNKWAVVFKYSSVTIASNATVTFKNHGSRAPVVWLVNGDITINGTLNLDGANWWHEFNGSSYVPGTGQQLQAEPGPGGFRGGRSWDGNGVGSSAGFGPGGGRIQSDAGYAGSFGSLGGGGSTTYGNPSLIPLIGGSGGGGDGNGYTDWMVRGAAGGGAILIASSQTISVTGIIQANGGHGYVANSRETGGGSGGGIRLIANVLSGGGLVQAIGGTGWYWGGAGRIRVERVANSSTLQLSPDASVVPLPAGDTALLWLPSDGPTARIVSVGAQPAPADPRADFGVQLADLTLPLVSTSKVVVETTNVESASLVRIRVTPRASGNSFTEVTADLESVVSSTPLVIRWTNDVPVDPGHSVVQARVVRP